MLVQLAHFTAHVMCVYVRVSSGMCLTGVVVSVIDPHISASSFYASSRLEFGHILKSGFGHTLKSGFGHIWKSEFGRILKSEFGHLLNSDFRHMLGV